MKLIIIIISAILIITTPAITATNKNFVADLVKLGEINYNLGNYQTAYDMFRLAIKAEPSNNEALKWFWKMKKEFDVAKLKDSAEPVNSLKEDTKDEESTIEEKSNTSETNKEDKVKVEKDKVAELIKLGVINYNLGNYRTAYDMFRWAVKTDPTNKQASKWFWKIKKEFNVAKLMDNVEPVNSLKEATSDEKSSSEEKSYTSDTNKEKKIKIEKDTIKRSHAKQENEYHESAIKEREKTPHKPNVKKKAAGEELVSKGQGKYPGNKIEGEMNIANNRQKAEEVQTDNMPKDSVQEKKQHWLDLHLTGFSYLLLPILIIVLFLILLLVFIKYIFYRTRIRRIPSLPTYDSYEEDQSREGLGRLEQFQYDTRRKSLAMDMARSFLEKSGDPEALQSLRFSEEPEHLANYLQSLLNNPGTLKKSKNIGR